MNLPEIRFTKPSFSFRFFIYLLFGLVILVLLVEGGYFFCVVRSNKICGGIFKYRFLRMQNELREISNNPETVMGKVVSISKEKVVIESKEGKTDVFFDVSKEKVVIESKEGKTDVFFDDIGKVFLINRTVVNGQLRGTIEPIKIPELRLGQTVILGLKEIKF